MKKMVRTGKKTLAMLLTVVMLMTAWVFVAPEKAEAVSVGSYPVKFYANVSDEANGCRNNVTITYITNNGKGNTTSQTYSLNSLLASGTGNGKTQTINVPGYPTKFSFDIRRSSGRPNVINVRLYRVDIGNKQVVNDGYSVNTTAWWDPRSWSWDPNNCKTSNWTAPRAETVVFDQNPSNVTLPKSGNTTTSFRTHLLDQYGVVVGSDAGYTKSASLTSNRNHLTGYSYPWGTTTSGYDPNTITMTQAARILNNYDNNTITATASYTFNGVSKSASKSFTVTDPQYVFYLNPNKGEIYHNNQWYSSQQYYTKYYGNTLPSSQCPAQGRRTGYEFIGMYSGSAKADNFSFTKPTAGSTSGYTGQLTTSTQYTADTTWYAAWWAKTYKATFLNNDGKELGKIDVKYDKTVKDVNASAVPADPEYHKKPGESGTYDYAFKGWRVLSAKDANGNAYYPDNLDFNSYVIKGDTVFEAVYGPTLKNYTVNFYDFNGNALSSKSDYVYGDVLIPPVLSKDADNTYTYKFKGWTSVAETAQKNGFLVDSTGRTDDGTYVGIAIAADSTVAPKVRDNAHYVPVFEKTYINYTVTFNFGDGETKTATVHYCETVDLPIVDDYFFTDDGFEHVFKNTWTKNVGSNTEEGVTLTSPFTVTENAIYTAEYAVNPAEYKVTIHDYDSREIGTYTVYHGDNFGYDYSGKIKEIEDSITKNYIDDTTEYEYSGEWKTADGINLGDLAGITPKSHMDIYPDYMTFARHTVNFYNGEELLESIKVTEDYRIPLPETNPSKVGDKYAEEYTFLNWADKDGNVYGASSLMPHTDLDLYAQYDCTPIDYTIKFVRDDGTVILEKTDYHYGEEVEVPTEKQLEKPQDDTYTYTFRDYDKVISETCDGDATYTASYRRAYRYYKVTWLNEDGTEIKSENYIFNERINPPGVTPAPVDTKPSDENHEIVFDAWHYCDASGNATERVYKRGDRLDGELTLMAGFVETEKIVKVTFLDANGEKFYEANVPFGTKLGNIAFPTPKKNSTDAMHFNFLSWNDGTNDWTTETKVIDDVTFTPNFAYEPHTYDTITNIAKAPTFFEEGAATYSCSCGMTQDKPIATLTDSVAPTSKLYIANRSWSSGDTVEEGEGIPCAPNNNLIINTNDKAYTDATKTDVDSKFNDINKGVGIAKIEYAVMAQGEEPTAWDTKFDFEALKAELYDEARTEAGDNDDLYAEKIAEVDAYLASLVTNASGRLSDIAVYTGGADLSDGDKFVVFVKVTDRKGNETVMNSPLMVYDTTPAKVELIGDYHAGTKYCETVIVKVDFQNAGGTVTLNGKAVALDENKQFTVDEKGIYQVVATDAAGNVTNQSFEIVGEHSWKDIEISATCDKDGEQYSRCLLCGEETEHIKIEALGHDTDAGVPTAPTCTERGFTTYTCKRCGEKTVVPDETEAGNPIGHDYQVSETLDATCVKDGYKIYTCTHCGDSYTETINAYGTDGEKGHSYYRPDITKPTCDKDGYGVRICKYCGHEDEITAATPGYEYLAERPDHEFEAFDDVAPTCTVDGVRKFKCANCGEIQKDAEGNDITEVIAALGHDFKFVETVEPTETEQGYTLYRCTRCGEEDKRDYTTKLEKFTVTYEFEGATKTIEKTEGETLTAAELGTPKKDADETYKYTFDKWVYADGTDVAFPLTIEADVTLKPQFSSRYINYTFTFEKEVEGAENVQVQKVGYLHNGTEVKLPDGPSKASDAIYDYDFDGWYVKGNPGTVYTTYTVDAQDLTFVAHYIAKLREYKVTFGINVDNILGVVTVQAGETAIYTGETPTKAYDKNAHYEFDGTWSKDITNVQSDMFVTANFKAIKHTYTDTEEQKATCTTSQIVRHTCDCGYSYTESSGSPAGHKWGTPVEVDGKMIQTCSVCGETREDPTTYTVEFYNDDGTTLVKRIGFLKYGEDITDRVPEPTKPSTDSEEYHFAGWDKDVETIVKGNAKYIAKYDAEPLKYVVIYAINSDNVLQTTTDVNGGTLLSEVPYTGATPTKAYDANAHYVFKGWSVDPDTKITKDLYILAQFDKVAHTYTDEPFEATCTTGSGIKHTCSCGYSYVEETGPAKGHEWVLIDSQKPTFDKPGYDKYECLVCHEIKVTDYEQKQLINVIITVYDHDGNAVEGAKVSLYDEVGLVASGTTNNNGVVILQVPEAKEYTIVISVDNGETSTGKITVDENGKITSGDVPHIDASKCECPCHNDGFWGAIFRFFHKIIKLITGEFKCCSNPDARYFK